MINDIEAFLRECIGHRLGTARECSPPRWASRTLGLQHRTSLVEPAGRTAHGMTAGPGFADFLGAKSAPNARLAALNDPEDTIARCEYELEIVEAGTVRGVIALARAYRHWPGWNPDWDLVITEYLGD